MKNTQVTTVANKRWKAKKVYRLLDSLFRPFDECGDREARTKTLTRINGNP